MSLDLHLDGVQLVYPTRRGDIDALGPIDLDVRAGEFVAVLGPSGCGKSTLVKLASGLLGPSAGEVKLGGQPVTGPSRRTGVVFQKPNLLPWKTVAQNVLLPARTLGLPAAPAAARMRELLKLVGLDGFADNYPYELSGGMQQRVGIARMLLSDPDVLLMDEPFAALDALTRELLTLELQRIWSQSRKSVLFITHSIPEAVFLADRIIVLSPRPGRIVEDFRPGLARPRTPDTLGQADFNEACQHLRQHFLHV
ncbi:ABC transporter [Bordetella genomosp. 7]|uniref:ABC transporter n=1 Tax=Bordetella genomosp. 7 TaxID=1416805 RepID=A0A261R0I2_9BORD|nr:MULTISPECIES: ABC transporter ATP-binding protein [Bordetella]OZI18237.1 ABC transporter [Bordetella genomosp. 7]OZI22035.1 ABC transporter [Bordetella genomosp. 7]